MPLRQLTQAALSALANQQLSLIPNGQALGKMPTARTLLRVIEPVPADACNSLVIARFEADPELDVLPVVHDNQPIGLINRHSMIDRFARPFRKELFGRKSCELFMEHAPLVVDSRNAMKALHGRKARIVKT